jgi:hypothetical protein
MPEPRFQKLEKEKEKEISTQNLKKSLHLLTYSYIISKMQQNSFQQLGNPCSRPFGRNGFLHPTLAN